MPSRDDALQLLAQWVDNDALRKHMRSVEAAVRFYARRFGEDEERWGLAGLLHDLDWEKYPDQHPLRGVDELRARGYPEDVLHAILAHRSDFTGVAPESSLDRTLLACDELTGLITAVALVRPSKAIKDVSVKSIKNKWKDKAFAAGAKRDEIEQGAQEFGVELWEHAGHVLAAMQANAAELGLEGIEASPAA